MSGGFREFQRTSFTTKDTKNTKETLGDSS